MLPRTTAAALRGFTDADRWESLSMPLLLVDDRDGRIIAELETQEQALRLLAELGGDDAPDFLCLVELHERPGAIFGTESSVTMRPLR
jgi:hypothetical protein